MKSAKYRHSPSTGGCPDCTDSVCSCDYTASYDMNSEILIPSGTYYWQNNSPPKYIHPTSCIYDVTITGFTAKSIEQSSFQNVNLNGSYVTDKAYYNTYVDGEPHISNYPSCPIIYLPLCTEETNPDAYNPYCWHDGDNLGADFTHLFSYFLVGIDDSEVLLDTTVCPSGYNNSYVYYNRNKTEEGRPQLYIWAITGLVFRELEGSDDDCGFNPYYFKTKVGEFNGDYTVWNYGHLYLNIPESEDCGIKYYHGDFDGRSIDYTVSPGDLWIYKNSTPDNYTRGLQSQNVPQICNFGTINIKSRANSFLNDNNELNSNQCELLYDIYYPGNYFYYPIPKYITATLGGVFSNNELPPESGDKKACLDCGVFNSGHILSLGTVADLTHLTSLSTTYPYDNYNNRIFYKEMPEICCQCFSYDVNPSAVCVDYLTAWIVPEWNFDNTYYKHIIHADILGSYNNSYGTISNIIETYTYDMDDWRPAPSSTVMGCGFVGDYATGSDVYDDYYYYTKPDLQNQTFTLSRDTTGHPATVPSGVCNFKDSIIDLSFGECSTIDDCKTRYKKAQLRGGDASNICHDRAGPEHVTVNIPYNWIPNPDVPPVAGLPRPCTDTHGFFGNYILSVTDGCCYGFENDKLIQFDWGYEDYSLCDLGISCSTVAIGVKLLKSCEDYYIVPGSYPTYTIYNTKNKLLMLLDIYFCPTQGYDVYSLGICVSFGKVIDDLSSYGTAIRCGGNNSCGDLPSFIGGYYTDCRQYTNVSLPYLAHIAMPNWYSWPLPYKWGGSPVTVSLLY